MVLSNTGKWKVKIEKWEVRSEKCSFQTFAFYGPFPRSTKKNSLSRIFPGARSSESHTSWRRCVGCRGYCNRVIGDWNSPHFLRILYRDQIGPTDPTTTTTTYCRAATASPHTRYLLRWASSPGAVLPDHATSTDCHVSGDIKFAVFKDSLRVCFSLTYRNRKARRPHTTELRRWGEAEASACVVSQLPATRVKSKNARSSTSIVEDPPAG